MEARLVRTIPDFRLLHALLLEYENDLPPNLRYETVPSESELHRRFAQPNAAFIAWLDGRAVGCVGMNVLDPQTAILVRLYVKARWRGRGAARALIDAVVSLGRDGGFTRIVLDTNKEQLLPAYRLYRSLGFSECAAYAMVSYESPTFMELRLKT